MIATVTIVEKGGNPTPKPCIVRWTGEARFLKIVAQSYCDKETSATVGVMQLPDKVIECNVLCDDCVRAFREYEASLNRGATPYRGG